MMTSENDARVAEIVEPKPDLPGTETWPALHRKLLRGGEWVSLGRAWELKFEYAEKHDKPNWIPRTFTTAPTHESDGIIQEWVQGQYVSFQMNIVREITALLVSRIVSVSGIEKEWMLMWICFGKPGDYAQALLAVLED